MKTLRSFAIALSMFTVLLLASGQLGFLAGTAPGDLGVKAGRLKPPSLAPNSVSSQASLYPDHPQLGYASVAPLAYQGDGTAAMTKLASILKNTAGTVVVTATDHYLYAQSSTRWLRFTDDVEFWLDDTAKVIHVRSASRIGRGDWGVNRNRVEAIRSQFMQN